MAYARNDVEAVKPLYRRLQKFGYKPWLDVFDLKAGQAWASVIPPTIETSDVFLAILSNRAVKKTGYVQHELRLGLVAHARRPPGEVFVIPAMLDDCAIPPLALPELGLSLGQFHALDLQKPDWPRDLEDALTGQAKRARYVQRGVDKGIKLSRVDWEQLELTVRTAAASAGIAAMGYYRNALSSSTALTKGANPSTLADEQATVAAIQAIYPVDRLAGKLGLEYRIFAEELDSPEVAESILSRVEGSSVHPRVKRSTAEFRENWEHSLSFLVDAIDGTTNFDAGIPFFCSAVALFIGGRLAIGAIYDPIHNQVHYGSLRALTDEASTPIAKVWTISAGNASNLKVLGSTGSPAGLIGTHIGRTNAGARNRFLRFLPFLCENRALNRGTYMLNSGQMALAHVASGALGAFVNNRTKIWDVAAGEVLIRAVGGEVTDFHGRDINYGVSTDISVLASASPELHARIKSLVRSRYPWGEGDT